MGFLDKLKGEKKNWLYSIIEKKLIADGKEHILQEQMSAIVSNKAISEFPEFMASKGFEVLDFDVMPSAIQNMKQIKVKYRSSK